MKEMWNNRYQEAEYAYGKTPNVFFKEIIDQQAAPGRLLLPAEGEGRNAVYAAQKGWEVHAFDISEAGKAKAERLAAEFGVGIHFQVATWDTVDLKGLDFDAVAMIYAHLPPPFMQQSHHKSSQALKPGGILIVEGFAKSHLPLRQANVAVGGPPRLDMLYDADLIRSDFPDLQVERLEEVEVELQEGNHHNGISRVVRFVGRK